MTFFLLARDADGRLALLADSAFSSRNDALAALGRLTAEPEFAYEGAEMFVLDLEEATPVLLVRPGAAPGEPAEAAVPVAELEPMAEEEIASAEVTVLDDTTVEDADIEALISAVAEDLVSTTIEEAEPVPTLEVAAEHEDVVVETPEDELVAEDDAVAELFDEEPVVTAPVDEFESAEPAILEPIVSEAEPLEAPAESAIEPLAESVEVDAAFAEAGVAESGIVSSDSAVAAEEADTTLRSALQRTTASMQQEGVEVPEAYPATSAWPWGSPSETAEGAEETTAQFEPVSVEPEAESPAALEETQPAPVTFDPLEEPAVDATPLLPTVVASPMSEASTEEPAVEQPAVDSDISDFILDVTSQPVSDAGFAPEAEPAVAIADAEPEVAVPDAELPVAPSEPAEAVAEVPAVEFATPVAEPALQPVEDFGSDLATLTCEDCVYIATCPNKGQLDPTSCGSFQWKTI